MAVRRFGRYEVVRELGHGGMATVYLARDPGLGRHVAVKVISQALARDPDARRRFDREAQAIARLEHPAIVPLYDHGVDRGTPYMVFRYMEGGTLLDLLAADGPLPVEDVNSIARRIGPALDYAHARGIIHRDIKPANILFDSDGDAWLSDFGIALAEDHTSSLTGSGWIGTPEYMAPEQAEGHAATPASDIYSLSVTLFVALAGRPPFYGGPPITVLMKHINEPPPDVSRFRPDTSSAASIALTRGMSKAPGDRWPTGRALADAITGPADAFLTTPSPSARTVQAAAPPAAARRAGTIPPAAKPVAVARRGLGWRRWAVMAVGTGAGAAAVVVAIAAAGNWYATEGDGSGSSTPVALGGETLEADLTATAVAVRSAVPSTAEGQEPAAANVSTPTITPTQTVTPTRPPRPTATATPTLTPAPTATATPTAVPTHSPTAKPQTVPPPSTRTSTPYTPYVPPVRNSEPTVTYLGGSYDAATERFILEVGFEDQDGEVAFIEVYGRPDGGGFELTDNERLQGSTTVRLNCPAGSTFTVGVAAVDDDGDTSPIQYVNASCRE